ncbi:TPA: hypothetical protein I8Y21_004088 [Klebsiella oxytoca]|uniref:2-dehydro-3-deoxygalactonokinase n=1 Tax=Klebsiella oxytoca TaxID=571 RepID=A0AAN5LBN0_KLEOX|nr:hypothetical protein [Klebsiella oxytoca]
MLIVTIDAGTTNTRVRVWQDSRVISDTSESVGVRDTAIARRLSTPEDGDT